MVLAATQTNMMLAATQTNMVLAATQTNMVLAATQTNMMLAALTSFTLIKKCQAFGINFRFVAFFCFAFTEKNIAINNSKTIVYPKYTLSQYPS